MILTYFIYFIVFIILLIVSIIAVKAINRGIEAKQNNKFIDLNDNDIENSKSFNKLKKNNDTALSDEIAKLNKLYSDGILNDEEFKKAKEKILK
tara:strand:- start:101 stop:382 length:282 start_codon:yes stop_codon:yes gene_type:complete